MKNYKIELKWGIIFIVVTLIWMMIERLAGLHDVHIDKHAIYTNIFAIPAIAMYVFALIEKRNKFYDGIISWKQAFIAGVIISMVVAILSPLAQVITLKVITPDYFSNVIEYSVSEGKMTQEEAESWFNISSYMWQSVIGALGMGIVTSAIVAIFVKRK